MLKNILTITIAGLFLFTLSYVLAAWTEPSVAPPGGNVPTPINVSDVSQIKEGDLTVSNSTLNALLQTDILNTIGGAILNTGGSPTGLIVQQGNVGIGDQNPFYPLDLTGSLRLQPSSAPAAAQGVIYFDSTDGKFKCSEDGLVFIDCIGGGGSLCPAGFVDTGYGYCIQINEYPVKKSWFKASDVCAKEYNARLCSVSEWYNACMNTPGLNLMSGDGKEWVDASAGDVGSQAIGLNGFCDRTIYKDYSDPVDFRCCRSL